MSIFILYRKGRKFEITGGNVMVTLKWIPKPHTEIFLLNEVLNLCDLLFELSHPCPLHPGKFVLLYQESIPIAIPEVMIAIKISTNINFAL